jgi:serine/threonine protein kinase
MIDVGQAVGNYNITAKLGEGGMGIVYLAEHPVIGSKVALKAIHPHFARSADVVSRFVTEARAVNQIGHDHIVNITDFGNTPAGDFYFIMEYLQGEMLSDGITHHGAFPPARALNIAAQIADALGASHEQGVIHRDLKPDNIYLITRDTTVDFVKVLDFGLAKLTHATCATPTHQTGAGTVMGTPFYMAPEQCEGKAELDHRADIYALGVMLFEMLTGHVPFGGTGYGEVLIKHVTLRPPTARSLVPSLPPSMDAILSRALAKKPENRFQSMAELRAALLDPEAYMAALPMPLVHDDLSGRMRAAAPRVRTEMKLELGSAPSTFQRTMLDGPMVLERPTPATSTFRQSAGEKVEELAVVPKRSRGGRLLFGAAAAAIAIAGVSSVHVRRGATQLLASALAPAQPSTVRVNFSSDPDGATVLRSDGTVWGVTPLSIDVPYGEAPISYSVRKDGYAAKDSSFVPNLPLPVFAVLVKESPAAPAIAAVPIDDPALREVLSTARTLAAAPRHHHHAVASRGPREPSEPNEPNVDEDDVLAPSAP